MMHILLIPLILSAHAGQWIDAHILSPFQIGETAKQVLEEELGVIGVLAYLIFKLSRLFVEAWPLLEPRWMVSRLARGVALVLLLSCGAWLITCCYVGLLISLLDLQVSYAGLLLAPVVAWVVLAYVILADRVRERRSELAAQSHEED